MTHNPFAALRPEGQPAAPSEPASEPGPRPTGRIVVRREKKGRGGKTVTRVSGLGLADEVLDGLRRELKRGLGCGATRDGDDLLLQGDLTARAAEWLERRLARAVTIGN